MTTLPPPKTNFFPPDSLTKQVYEIVEKFKDNIPIPNDRNRLGYALYKYMTGEGDPPHILVKSTKIVVENISREDLAAKLTEVLTEIKPGEANN
jgi:hypothetical protein